MLRKLRIKFIAVNMVIFTIMLYVIFSSLFFTMTANYERESMQMMNMISEMSMRKGPIGADDMQVKVPYACVMLDKDGNIKEKETVLMDESTLQDIIAEAETMAQDEGKLTGYRYMRRVSPMGKEYVIVDITGEQTMAANLLRSLIMTGILAFAAFLGISILLARWAIKPVEKAWTRQKQFVADASHELKTPLTVIMTDSELLRAPDCADAERKELAGSIVTMAGQMRGLVENMLEMARIDAGSVKKQHERADLSAIVNEAALMFEPLFFEKDMPFTYLIADDIFVTGSPSHLKELATILLDNASKYAAPRGDVVVTLRRAGSKCLLSVADRGDPIPPDELKKIFERFYRADKARAINHSYGLGLSIADSIAKEHGGKIWAESKGGYNTFYCEVPAASRR